MQKKLSPKWILAMSFLSLAVLSGNGYSEENSNDPFSTRSAKSHEVILLNHGLASLEVRLQMIERAQKTIDVEYFIYRTDKSAKLFTQALVKKAREGVKVRMLLDYFMVKSDLSPFFTHELEKEGIEIKYFNTTSSLNMFSGQYRNHRKVLLIDGQEALTGGRNIGDEYFDLHHEYNFLDREIHLQGELVSAIQKTFDKTFNAKLSERVKRKKMPESDDIQYRNENDDFQFERDLNIWKKKVKEAEEFVSAPMESALHDNIRSKGQEELDREFHGKCEQMTFLSEYPNVGTKNRKKDRIIKHNIFERINNSKESIVIDSPYFIVNDELGQSLERALDNKVDVKLLTNSLNSTDAIYVYAAFDSIAKKWLNKGLDSFIFKGIRPASYDVLEDQAGKARFGVHSKVFIFDQKDVVIGTYNVDPRSANYNSEMVVTCENSPELAAEVKKDIDSRLEGSIHLDSEKAIEDAEFYQIGFGKKLVYYFLKIPSNIFDYLL